MIDLKRNFILFGVIFFVLAFSSISWSDTIYQIDPKEGILLGDVNGVKIYGDPDTYPYGRISNNLAYQCVELVRRYFYQKHNMFFPNISTGCAKDIINEYNGINCLTRCLNNETSIIPDIGDILVFDATAKNMYGHVAIVSNVDRNIKTITFAQQNWPQEPFGQLKFRFNQGKIMLEDYKGYKVLGFLSQNKSKSLDIITEKCNPQAGDELESYRRAWIVFSKKLAPNYKDYIEIATKKSQYKISRKDSKESSENPITVVIIDGLPWIPEDDIKIKINKEITDISGNQMENDFHFNFKIKKQDLPLTGPSAQQNEFRIVSTQPANNAKDINTRKKVIIQFSSDIDTNIENDLSKYVNIRIIWFDKTSFLLKTKKIYLQDKNKIVIEDVWPLSHPFRGDTKVIITINKELTALNGQRLKKDFKLIFSTIK